MKLILSFFLLQTMVFSAQASQSEIRFDASCDTVCVYTNFKHGAIMGSPEERYPTPMSFNLDNVTREEYESVTKSWEGLQSMCASLTPEKYKGNHVEVGGDEYAKELTEKTVKCDINYKSESEGKIDAACSYTCVYEAEQCWDGCWDTKEYSTRYIDLKGLTKKEFSKLNSAQLELDAKCEMNPAKDSNYITIKKSLGASKLNCVMF